MGNDLTPYSIAVVKKKIFFNPTFQFYLKRNAR